MSFNKFLFLSSSLFFLIVRAQDTTDTLLETYMRCRDTLGKPNWLCDPENRIYHQTADEINDLLWRLQTDVPCYCRYSNDCYRFSNTQFQSGIVAAMIITSYLPQDFVVTAQRIYNDAKLATANCSNGLLIVYAIDGRNLYSYRGELTERTLDQARALNILNDTMDQLQTQETQGYRYALPELLKNYLSYLKGQTYDRQRTWEAMVGMVVAVVICGFAVAAALGIFCAYCCCKKRKSPREIMAKSIMYQTPSTEELIKQMKANRQKMLLTASGTKISPKRLMEAQQKAIAARSISNGKTPLVQPPEEPYYVISEPSTMYSSLPRDSPTSVPAVTYPDSTISQAYLEPSLSPPPEHEVQRRDLIVTDEDEQKSITSKKKPQPPGSPPHPDLMMIPEGYLDPLLPPLPPKVEIQRRDLYIPDEAAKQALASMKKPQPSRSLHTDSTIPEAHLDPSVPSLPPKTEIQRRDLYFPDDAAKKSSPADKKPHTPESVHSESTIPGAHFVDPTLPPLPPRLEIQRRDLYFPNEAEKKLSTSDKKPSTIPEAHLDHSLPPPPPELEIQRRDLYFPDAAAKTSIASTKK